jgi:hypothetical protein
MPQATGKLRGYTEDAAGNTEDAAGYTEDAAGYTEDAAGAERRIADLSNFRLQSG